MTFLHKETTWTVQTLTRSWDKQTYVAWSSITGHLKPLSTEDSTFNTTWISWAIYKFTVKVSANSTKLINYWDKFVVWSDTYVCKDSKPYNWITFWTSKFLLVKE